MIKFNPLPTLFPKFLFFVALFLSSLVHGGSDIDFLKKDDSYFKKVLAPEVYDICRAKATERAGSGQYDHFYEEGTYYCACCGGDYPLYNSAAKFDSKTGWPSFTAPISDKSVNEKPDDRIVSKFFGARTEITCSRCGSHLGHVFDDGPEPTHKRYCMNSKALIFVPKGKSPKRTFPE